MLKRLVKKFSKKQKILDQLTEKQPLPLGVKEFHAWSERVIDAAMIGADVNSQKFALADMILRLNATEDHKEDGYFVKVLRKTAVNQVADYMRREIKDAADAKQKAEAEAKAEHEKALETEYVPPEAGSDVLEKQTV